MKICSIWFIGPDGPVSPPSMFYQEQEIDDLYAQIPGAYRYVLGIGPTGEFLCWDVYASQVSMGSPFKVTPHFVDKFENMDHALAALTINYEQNTALWRKRAMAVRKLRFRKSMET